MSCAAEIEFLCFRIGEVFCQCALSSTFEVSRSRRSGQQP
jgi:hypothetical protein